ncbi:BnaCnng42820D [Brassica napus]|uniref:ABC-type xenobiotic transporter n=1 Tax=Brassica napus TaxID=3708 RepID=A0A078JFM5_BRANA|nr:BnaCnng42820D [Brassica napus]
MENPLDFLLIQPIYLPLLSFFLNMVLLLILFVSWVYNKKVACENSDDFMAKRSTNMSSTFSKLVVMCCVSLSVFYSVLSLLSCVRWHSNVWTLFDLLLAALTWGTISMYLRGLYIDSHEQKLPYLLRVWWVFYFLISCYRLVVDFALYKKQELVSVHNVVSDLVGVCAGLLLCCSCLWKKGEEGETTTLLEEPFLSENEGCDDEVTTHFSKAGFLSLVSFSWMSPLVTLGNEKIIDSNDVPQVDSSDRAENLFRVFRSQLEWDDEAGWLKKFVYNSAAMSSVLLTAPSFISATAFGACVLLKIPLESGKILAALAIFQILQSPIYKLPETISMFVQVKVSLGRIASFLCLDDLEKDVVERLTYSEMALEVSNGCFSWDNSSSIPTLREVSFEVSHGMNVAVCGTVGSGKSSLLSSILGEVPKISGTVKVFGSKAYVAQSPWIQSGKVEDNILFGKPMEREWYQSVLEACCLNKDLELLPFHDQTVIGERGINLSGGQKQRIQIARALYQDADIYLFDDPFSAVDAHTGSHLFKEVILGVLKDKTVIYVTHQVEFLPEADLILVMKDGKITQAGRYNEILDSGTDFMELVGAHTDALATVDTYEQGCASSESTTNKEDKEAPKLEKDSGNKPRGQLVQQEEREKGKVGFTVYKKYMALAYGGAVIPIILLVQILFQVLDIGSNYWMTWVTPVSKDVEPPVSGFTLILVYVVLAIASSLCILVRTLLVSMTGFKMATELFTQMHLRVFRASMSFFDVTPMGRILNRASTDQSVVDLRLPGQFAYAAVAAINILGIMGVMIQVAWLVLIIFIPVVAASSWYRQYYISAARELARLAGISRSPLVHHFSETLSGVTTIRSFDQEPRFLSDIMKLSDCLSRLTFHSTGATEWLCFRLELLSTITFALSLVIVVSTPEGTVNPSFAGLAITYALNLNNLQSNLVWTLCELENKMISVERMLQYIDIPSEPSLVIESTRPEKSWPSRGEITISNLQVRYGPHLPMVLHGLTCTFPGGLKTGIVGRTGCGKSTLIQTLFRIVEPTAGEIRIDGIDILTIGLHDLRSRLSIIPQDPTMFEGTVRSNLDPLEEYSDDQIWEALDKCQLGDEVRKKELKLDSSVSENGQNWSVGQRQLVCLGRVLLKRSKVLVLDEATASVDTATDNLIQETLRQHFRDCTVITIAHRISSVIDSDMVLLLDQGLIKEHDSPGRLLEDKSSSFSKLVAEYTTSSESKFSRSC